jgi:hypothetical protein
MKEEAREACLVDGWRCAFLPRGVGGSKRGSIMFRQFVEGGDVSRNPIYGVLENNKKEEGAYGGGIEPRFK